MEQVRLIQKEGEEKVESQSSTFVDINRKAYASPDVVNYYAGLEELFPSERVLFNKLSSKIRFSKVLDLGIGGGRTTKYLLPISGTYVGLDYVASFIEIAKRKYEKGVFVVGDARDLTQFLDESFDVVVFSFNGLDAMSHEDRLRTLKEIFRVLNEEGAFIFSSHNRNYEFFRKPYWFRNRSLKIKLVKNALSYLALLPRHLWMKRLEIFNDEYAIINDSDHRYSLMIYYMTIAAQKAQLREIGFEETEAYDETGYEVVEDSKSFWIYYLTKKSTGE